jgi:voltage-gated potassium channel
VPGLSPAQELWLTLATLAISLVFCLEHGLRLWAARAAAAQERGGPGRPGVLSYAASPMGLVDLASGVALPLALLAGLPGPTARLLGAVWILKIFRYTTAFDLLIRVFRSEREPLTGVLSTFLIVLFLAATGGYLAERQMQPQAFGSVPRALWWAITTLTTTGYGDEIPVTVAGRVLGGLVMVCGIGLFALFAGILASGFSQELRRRDFLRTWDLVARVPLFAAVGATTIADVTLLLKTQDLPAGRLVVRRGEQGDCMYFVAEGEVFVRLPGRDLPIGAGGFLGEVALIQGRRRSADVITRERTRLLKLDIADFRRLAAERPELAKAIEAEAGRRLAENRDWGQGSP